MRRVAAMRRSWDPELPDVDQEETEALLSSAGATVWSQPQPGFLESSYVGLISCSPSCWDKTREMFLGAPLLSSWCRDSPPFSVEISQDAAIITHQRHIQH